LDEAALFARLMTGIMAQGLSARPSPASDHAPRLNRAGVGRPELLKIFRYL
jgi:hypothetical protein